MSELAKGCLVFFSVFFGDICWTRYIQTVGQGAALRAAIWNSLILALGGFTVVEYTTNHWLLLPAILGGFAGTLLAVMSKK